MIPIYIFLVIVCFILSGDSKKVKKRTYAISFFSLIMLSLIGILVAIFLIPLILIIPRDWFDNSINSNVTESNINDYGRFDDLKNSVDKEKAKAYLEEIEGCKLPIPRVNIKVHNLLKEFILGGGYELKS